MPVVLARRSVVGRRREIADSGAFGGTHNTGCRMLICVLWGQAWRWPCLLELHAPLPGTSVTLLTEAVMTSWNQASGTGSSNNRSSSSSGGWKIVAHCSK
jgi:hypothetical protein